MTENNRVASGEAAAKALWDQEVAALPIDHSRLCGDEGSLDSRDGVGNTVVRMDEQELPPPVSASSSVHQPFPSILPVDERSKVWPFVGIIIGAVGLLVLLVSWMGGAA